jgi:hypothetical protein
MFKQCDNCIGKERQSEEETTNNETCARTADTSTTRKQKSSCNVCWEWGLQLQQVHIARNNVLLYVGLVLLLLSFSTAPFETSQAEPSTVRGRGPAMRPKHNQLIKGRGSEDSAEDRS